MKKLIVQDDVFGMTKVSPKYVDVNRTGHIESFIYISDAQHSTGPRIKFYGGTSETMQKNDAPSFTFSPKGPGFVELQPWMNSRNCPNAYDKGFINQLETFVQLNLPILLLLWYYKIDEADVIQYLYGHISFDELKESIDSEESFDDCKNMRDLHKSCLQFNLYSF